MALPGLTHDYKVCLTGIKSFVIKWRPNYRGSHGSKSQVNQLK